MDEKFLKPYNPQETEKRIYDLWEESGLFNPDICVEKGYTAPNAEPFSIVMPPPNVTGILHMGHALMLTIEDIMIRYKRMCGYKTLWIPGTDHAAIATQSKVEKEISKKEKINPRDLGREELLKRIQTFAKDSHDTIISQVKVMGASCDWSREAFTLDSKRNFAVNTLFKKMYDDGLIYQGERIVNWDPKGQTTISDDEIVYIEEKTKFYYFKYGPFIIGTARPETKFGDKYVVMHPNDTRYGEFKHGDKITVEWINGPIEATIVKDTAIDMEFGTGVMTITPWHSTVDFEIAEKHKLDKEQIIDKYGKLLPIAGADFVGQKIKDAREKIVEKLQSKGLLVDKEGNPIELNQVEDYTHNIATAERTGGIIEPQIMKQWFIAVNKEFSLPHSNIDGIESGSKTTLKEIMRKTVETKQIKIIPEYFDKTYFHWIDNLRDWCISRQIWYGHRVPAFYDLTKKENDLILVYFNESLFNSLNYTGEQILDLIDDISLDRAGKIFPAGTLNEFVSKKICTWEYLKNKYSHIQIYEGLHKPEIIITKVQDYHFQDEDTLDTWFSSGAWTFSTLGWPYNKSIKFHEKYVEKIKNKEKTSTLRPDKKEWFFGETLRLQNSQNNEFFGFAKIISAEKIKLSNEDLSSLQSHYPERNLKTGDDIWKYDFIYSEKSDLEIFHPTDVLETGYEILFFWVARMILMSGYALGEIPFKTVYLHGTVRDGKGQKMSKSLGNGIDPLDVAKEFGSDAGRMALVYGTAPGTDSKISNDKIKGYKHFANKLWNITRFVLENTKDEIFDKDFNAYSPIDSKLREERHNLMVEITKEMDDFLFHIASEKIYGYVWHEFADKILEESKKIFAEGNDEQKKSRRQFLLHTLDKILRVLHPFMPFVTEEIWQTIGKDKLLMVEKWPIE